MSIRYKTIVELRNLLDNKSISPLELHQETCQAIAAINPELNALVEMFAEYNQPSSSEKTLLQDIPFVHKDNILVKHKRASAGSLMLKDHVSPYTATVMQRIFDAGGYTVGRANCDEFAMGSSGETSYYGPTKNPWDVAYVPGGSSSGSAVVVAAGLVPYSFGSETGGSVRQPAVLCGVTGLKTTYGLHSRFGLIAYASSLDQIGIFTHTAEDAAIVLSTTAGHDPLDHSTHPTRVRHNYCLALQNSIKGKRIAVIENALHADGVSAETKENLLQAIKEFENMGCIISYIRLSTMEYSAALYFIISRAEAASNLSRYDGVRYGYRSDNYSDLQSMYQNTRGEGFGYTVKRRLILGNYVLAAEYADEYYNKAKRIQAQMKQEFMDAFQSADCLFCPVTPEPAFKLGDMINNPLAIDLQDYFTAAVNLVGLPALALPSGFINNMPIGFQLIGNYFDEETILSLGHQYQQKTEWHRVHPRIKENYND
jgi:aspartyl-tRNA(Asn)/glutamyl-tRNA(Gln) amidotransferase subunit A